MSSLALMSFYHEEQEKIHKGSGVSLEEEKELRDSDNWEGIGWQEPLMNRLFRNDPTIWNPCPMCTVRMDKRW